MIILQVHNHYQIPGGEDTVVVNERRMLEDHGHKVICYTRDNKELQRAGRLKKLGMYAESFFSFRTYREIRRILRQEKVDIVHVHNTVHLISPSVFYAAVKERVPVVQTIHNFRILCPGALFYRDRKICEECLQRGLHCAVRHKCYRGSRLQTAAVALSEFLQRISGIRGKIRYICLTEFNRAKLLQINRNGKEIIPPEHVFIKPNFTPEVISPKMDRTEKKLDGTGIVVSGPDEKETDTKSIKSTPDKNAADTKSLVSGLKEKEYYVTIGRLEQIKGTHLIVKAFAHTGLPLVMIGSGEQEEKIREYIRKYNISNIRLTGQLPHEEVMSLLKNAKALVMMPQLYEGMCMNILEAYAFGIPVITGDIGNASAMVLNDVTGIKCQNNVKDLERALDRFEIIDRNNLSENALREYEERYSEKQNYEILMKIYEKSKNAVYL